MLKIRFLRGGLYSKKSGTPGFSFLVRECHRGEGRYRCIASCKLPMKPTDGVRRPSVFGPPPGPERIGIGKKGTKAVMRVHMHALHGKRLGCCLGARLLYHTSKDTGKLAALSRAT